MSSILCVVSHSAAGGAQELWTNLAAALFERGHTVSLVALYPNKASIRKTPEHIPWTHVNPARPEGIVAEIGAFARLARFLRDKDADFAITALPAANTLVPLAAEIAHCRTKVVTSHHGPIDTLNPWLTRLDGAVGRLHRVLRIVSVSKSVKDSFSARGGSYRSKSVVIKNALPPPIEQLIGSLRTKNPFERKHGRTIIATGRLHPQKNYDVLLRAAVHMPDVAIRIVGTGPDKAILESRARELGVSERVQFLGFRDRTEALSILSEGDIFVQPSLYEGHSLALVEAAKLGIPLIVSNVPVQLEAITASDGGRCGIAIDPHDDKALAANVLELLALRDSKYTEHARRALVLGSESDFDTMISQYEDIIVE